MQLRNPFKTTQLADSTTAPSKQELSKEIGVAGNVVFNGFDNEEARTDKIKIEQYRKMIDTDATAEGIFNLITLPVIAATYRIDADENDSGEVQAEFVRKNLFQPPHKGGMETPFSLFLDELVFSVVEGFSLWNRVFRINDDGLYEIRKLAHRDSTTITLRRDEVGGYAGAVQRINYNGKYIDVKLDPEKTFLFTHGKARDFLYGRSAFMSAYKNYDKKRRLEYLDSIALQNDAIKPKLLKRTQQSVVSKDDKAGSSNSLLNKALVALSRLGEMKPVASIPYGYDVQELNSEGRDPHTSIERQNSEMARAVFAQLALQGTQGKESNVGSYSLSTNQKDVLMIFIKSFMEKAEEHINQYLIADLIRLNYAEPHFPEFHFDDPTSDTIQIVTEAFMKLIEKDKVSDEMVQGLEDEAANRLGIDLEQIRKERQKQQDKEAKKAQNNANEPPQPPVDPGNPGNQPDPNNPGNNNGGAAPNGGGFPGNQLSDQQWWRPLTPAEQTVKFADINKRMDGMEAQFIESMTPIVDKVKAAIVDMAKSTSQADVNSVSVVLPKEYSKTVLATIKTAYNFAKTGAADELRVSAPANTQEASAGMQQLADFVISKQQGDLTNLLKSELLKAYRTNQLADTQQDQKEPPKTFLDELILLLGTWFASKLKDTATSIVSQSVNNGRNDVFAAIASEDDLFQYSALLDDKICPICKDLDGSVVKRKEYLETRWKPPIHFHCRCLWVLIRKMVAGKTDTELPKVTGLPNSAGGVTGPTL